MEVTNEEPEQTTGLTQGDLAKVVMLDTMGVICYVGVIIYYVLHVRWDAYIRERS